MIKDSHPLCHRYFSLDNFISTAEKMNHQFTIDKSYAAAFYIFTTWNEGPRVYFCLEGPESDAKLILLSMFKDMNKINEIKKEFNFSCYRDLLVDLLGVGYIDYFQMVVPYMKYEIPYVISYLSEYNYINSKVINSPDKIKKITNINTKLINSGKAVTINREDNLIDVYRDIDYLRPEQRDLIKSCIPNYNAFYYKQMNYSSDVLCKVPKSEFTNK